jgi:hypothetical protein
MGLVLWDVRELRDPPELPNIFRGTAFQWRRCVRSCTSTAPSPPMRGGVVDRRLTQILPHK